MIRRAGLAVLVVLSLVLVGGTGAVAGDVRVEKVVFVAQQSGQWAVHTTLRHADAGWEHYADAWRVVQEDGAELGLRTLFHPHETEQPFTRSLQGVKIPEGVGVVYVEAHDKVHGWAADRVRVELEEVSGERFTVKR
ncbi:MAG: hypothetical protein ACI8PT_001932 [Gammaproteobacteria bacterium]|jgi:hypothetical protein